MFCPRCSKKFEAGTSYCRTCGLSLDEVQKVISGEADSEPEFKRRPNGKLIQAGIATFMLGLVVALANAALSTALGYSPDAGKVIFLSMVAIGMLLLALGFIFQQKQYVKHRNKVESNRQDKPALSTAPLQDQLVGSFDPLFENEVSKKQTEVQNAEVSSVTEHTTRQLS